MKVAIIVERFEPARGGVEQAAFALARELAARAFDVHVICRRSGDQLPTGVQVVRLRIPAFWQPLRVWSFSRAAHAATRRGYDLVHSFARTRHQQIYRTGGGSHAAYMDRVYADAARRKRFSPRHRSILSIEEAVFRDPSQIIQCNAKMNALEIATRYAVPKDRLTTIYNGVDIDRFHPRNRETQAATLQKELQVEGPVVLFVGNGFHRKGLDIALQGLADSGQQVTLLVAGAGDRPSYAKLAERLGITARVKFLGPRRDIATLHAIADLMLLPTRYDPFSNACLEAMASGVPIATTTTNGAVELIEHGVNGIVIDQHAESAYRALTNPDALAAMGRAARKTAEAFTWKRHADEVIRLYGSVLR